MHAHAPIAQRADELLARADDAAAAALRELPEALVIVFDTELRYILAAGSALERVGEDSRLRQGTPVADAFPQEVRTAIEPLLRSALQGETRSREIWTKDRHHCLMVDAGPLAAHGEPGAPVQGGVAVVVDITARRQADIVSGRSCGRGFEDLFDQAPVATGLLDMQGRWLMVNRALCDLTGYTSGELIGTRSEGIVHPDDADSDLDQRQALLEGTSRAFRIRQRFLDASGETVTVILSMSVVRAGDGSPLHYIAQLLDISERRRLEEQVRHLADHDPLTGLRNRRLFDHDLRLQVARSQRYEERAGLMLIDLDGFGELNNTHGEAVGDEILRAVARALGRRLRQTDLVARSDGDEFAVLLPHIDQDGIAVVADGLSRVLPACAVDAGEVVVHPRASIAFVLIDGGAVSAEQVMADAKQGMLAAKGAGSGRRA